MALTSVCECTHYKEQHFFKFQHSILDNTKLHKSKHCGNVLKYQNNQKADFSNDNKCRMYQLINNTKKPCLPH